MNKNYYEVLNVNPDISLEELKKVYHKLALEWHPDKWATKSETERKVTEENFKEVSVAYKEILEERKSKLAIVKAEAEDTEKDKTTSDTNSSEKFNKEEKEKIEKELKKVDDEWLDYNLRFTVSAEVLHKLRELTAQGLSEKEISFLWIPYGTAFAKIWDKNLSKEEVINFKTQLFVAIEEEIKKAKEVKAKEEEEKKSRASACYACGKTETDTYWRSYVGGDGTCRHKRFCSDECFKPFFEEQCEKERKKRIAKTFWQGRKFNFSKSGQRISCPFSVRPIKRTRQERNRRL